MKKRGWSARVVVRYALLQVPFTLLLVLGLIMVRRWMDLPVWFICGVIVLWVLKDVALFPLLWRAYDPDSPGPTSSMEGKPGMAVEYLNPSGYVEVRGELWKAEVTGGRHPIRPGTRIRVCGIRGLTLLVQPDSEGEKPAPEDRPSMPR
jgi:membrane protein implicated in regulation of membrane protease activity